VTALAQEVRPRTVGETGYQRIRTDILFGRLAPGSRLRLDRLKSEYGVSVSTLREILSRLSSERLVVAEGQKGFQVAPVSAADLKEIAMLRQMLECRALEQSFSAGDTEWEGRVVAAHHRLARVEEKMMRGDRSETEQWRQYDREFHQALISACGSKMLIETHTTVFEKYLRYQMIALGFRGNVAIKEHAKLRDCALDRNAAKACEILQIHVAGGVTHALAAGKIARD
jgi:DNA-binding GntR family transcriptional regulator